MKISDPDVVTVPDRGDGMMLVVVDTDDRLHGWTAPQRKARPRPRRPCPR
jgi:hypothetical protein